MRLPAAQAAGKARIRALSFATGRGPHPHPPHRALPKIFPPGRGQKRETCSTIRCVSASRDFLSPPAMHNCFSMNGGGAPRSGMAHFPGVHGGDVPRPRCRGIGIAPFNGNIGLPYRQPRGGWGYAQGRVSFLRVDNSDFPSPFHGRFGGVLCRGLNQRTTRRNRFCRFQGDMPYGTISRSDHDGWL